MLSQLASTILQDVKNSMILAGREEAAKELVRYDKAIEQGMYPVHGYGETYWVSGKGWSKARLKEKEAERVRDIAFWQRRWQAPYGSIDEGVRSAEEFQRSNPDIFQAATYRVDGNPALVVIVFTEYAGVPHEVPEFQRIVQVIKRNPFIKDARWSRTGCCDVGIYVEPLLIA